MAEYDEDTHTNTEHDAGRYERKMARPYWGPDNYTAPTRQEAERDEAWLRGEVK